jgi:hypothetical protein
MKDPFTAWLDASTLIMKAQSVIALRMVRLAAGDAAAFSEAQRMVCEKAIATAEAQAAVGLTLATGRGLKRAVSAAATPYRRRVRANHRRLTRRRQKS